MRYSISLLVIILMLCTGMAFGTVNKTIKTSGGDYTNFQNAWNSIPTTPADDYVFEAYTGTYPAASFNSKNQSGSYTITFKAATGEKPVIATTSSYGLYLQYTDRVKLEGLTISAATYAIRFRYYVDGCRVEDCVLSGPGGVDIERYCDDDSIIGNYIRATSNYGIYIYNSSTSYRSYRPYIANNMITGWTSYGIYTRYVSNTYLYYNTIVGTGSYAYYAYEQSTGYVATSAMQNNILMANSYAVQWQNSALPTVSDYNCFRLNSGGTHVINHSNYGGGQILSTWQTLRNRDLNSMDADPLVGGHLNAHLKTGSPCIEAATPITGITDDIDGDTRDVTTPDIGADEYTSVAAPMSGTYTVKQDGTGNYASIIEALGDLQLRGAGGNVTFDVYAGTYLGALDLHDMNNAAYQVTVKAHEATDGAIDVVSIHCGNAQNGVWLRGVKRFRFRNLRVGNYNSYGFYFDRWTYTSPYQSTDTCLIEGCVVTGKTPVYLNYGCDDDSLIGNYLLGDGNSSYYGLRLNGSSGAADRINRTVIVNNFIRGGRYSSTSYSSVYMYYHYDTKLVYNTIHTGTYSSGTYNAVRDYYGYLTEVKDNIFYVYRNASNTYCYYKSSGSYATNSPNYNCYWRPYSGGNINWFDGNYTWGNWQTSVGDANGINADPLMVGPTDPHIKLGSPCIAAGTPVTGFDYDIDGNDRDDVTPDIGCDEQLPGSALSGEYDIKQDGTGDYTSFAETFTAIAIYGIGGDVTFNVYSGTYSEALDFQGFPNGLNQVTYRAAEITDGAYEDVALDAGGSNYAVWLKDNTHLAFRRLKVTNFNTYGFYLDYISSGSDTITIADCEITGPNGIWLDGYCDYDSIYNNTIKVTSNYGIDSYTGSNWWNYYTYIAGNMISGWTNSGIYLNYFRNTELYYNTSYNSARSNALHIRYCDDTEMQCNLLGAATYAFWTYQGEDVPDVSDYNCFYSPTNTNMIRRYNNTYTLSTWRSYSSKDGNSIDDDPEVFSNNDLHIEGSSPCIEAGTPVTGIAYDIDGDARDATDPDIGADERYIDISVTEILVPSGTYGIGASVTPKVRLQNLGGPAHTFSLWFKGYRGGSEEFSELYPNHVLAPGADDTVDFTTSWDLLNAGSNYLGLCWHTLSPDDVPGNDTKSEPFSVGNVDVGVEEILAPVGDIAEGATVYPQVRMHNYGDFPATFNLTFTIDNAPTDAGGTDVRFSTSSGTEARVGALSESRNIAGQDALVYNETEPVTIPAGGDLTHTFATGWTATPVQTFAGHTDHDLAFDTDRSNDTADLNFDVVTVDVGVEEILAPAGNVAEGATVYPQVRMHNYGAFPATFNLTFTIDNAPADAGGTDVRLSTSSGTEAPVGALSESRNIAGQDALVYNETEPVTIPAGGDLTHTFAPGWTATPQQTFAGHTHHDLAFDADRHNDTADLNFDVVPAVNHDVGVTTILRPAGTVVENTVVYPKVTVHNYGEVAETFDVRVIIDNLSDGEVFNFAEPVTGLGFGETRDFEFTVNSWLATPEQTFHVRCTTELGGDADNSNDMQEHDFSVSARPPWPERWSEAAPMPLPPSQKSVKRGGWLAFNEANGLVYAAKGYKTTDFYRYHPVGDSWHGLTGMPYETHPLWSRKVPRKGSKGVSDGDNSIYVTQGNNTLGFWRYDIVGGSWGVLPDVPLGPYRKKVKGGTDLAFVPGEEDGDDYVYLLKGYKTEFYRYNVATSKWDTLAEAPDGTRAKWDKGSWLVFNEADGTDDAKLLYAHKAKYHDGTYHELWKYNIVGDSWSGNKLKGMPLEGLHSGRLKRKKSKDGGCGAWYDDEIYALKGGNTQQYFRYTPAADSWHELDTVPNYTVTTGRKRRVKYGADIVSYGGGVFFALKGNKTRELWRYVIPYTLAARPSRDGVMAGRGIQKSEFRIQISPNPLASGFATLRYTLPKAGPVDITIYDIAGRAVKRIRVTPCAAQGCHPMNLRSLSAGVYLVRLDADGFTATRKLVVQH